MALNVWFSDDIKGAIVGGIVLAVESDQGRTVEYLRGVLALARHQAAIFCLDWSSVIADVRGSLGDDLRGLLDQARQIESG